MLQNNELHKTNVVLILLAVCSCFAVCSCKTKQLKISWHYTWW